MQVPAVSYYLLLIRLLEDIPTFGKIWNIFTFDCKTDTMEKRFIIYNKSVDVYYAYIKVFRLRLNVQDIVEWMKTYVLKRKKN